MQSLCKQWEKVSGRIVDVGLREFKLGGKRMAELKEVFENEQQIVSHGTYCCSFDDGFVMYCIAIL